MNRIQIGRLAACMIALLLMVETSSARIKLITTPPRERVEIRLDGAETLVEEERIVPLTKTGEGDEPNQIDFTCANTPIDASSILFRILGPAPGKENEGLKASVLSVTYPEGGQSLVWQVAANKSGSVRVSISYLLWPLEAKAQYRAFAQADEKSLRLERYVVLRNDANEEFLSHLNGESGAGIWLRKDLRIERPVGLDESKRLLVETLATVPLRKEYRCSPREEGWLDEADHKLKVAMRYAICNDKESGMGVASLPEGKVRIFLLPAKDAPKNAGYTFLGEDEASRTLVGETMRLQLGLAQDIVVRRFLETVSFKERIDYLYEGNATVRYEIENFKDTPVTLEISENVKDLFLKASKKSSAFSRGAFRNASPVTWELADDSELGEPDPERSTAENLLFKVDLPARGADGKAVKVEKRLSIRFPAEIE